MAKKYYAIKNGHKNGIYTSWDEAKIQVDGFANAQYKGFNSLQEANDYLNGNVSKTKTGFFKKTKITLLPSKELAIAYSDGSFRESDNSFSFGTVLLWNDSEYHFSKRFYDEKLSLLRNVAGEVIGSKKAMEFCFNNKIKKLVIHHDYQGIAKWITGDWEAKNDFTKSYVQYAKKISKEVEISFVWVKGHSGNHYNEIADKLAADAGNEMYYLEMNN